MQRANPPFPVMLVEMLLDEEYLAEAKFINQTAVAEFIEQSASLIRDPDAQAWLKKVLTTHLPKSKRDTRAAKPEELPDPLPPNLQAALDRGFPIDAFEASAETQREVQQAAKLINRQPELAAGKATYAALLDIITARSGETRTELGHTITKVKDGANTVYTLVPDSVRSGTRSTDSPSVTHVLTVKTSNGDIVASEGFKLGCGNADKLQALVSSIAEWDDLYIRSGVHFVGSLSGGLDAFLLVSPTANDWAGVMMNCCIGDSTTYERGCSCYIIVNRESKQIRLLSEYRSGKVSQVHAIKNRSALTPEEQDMQKEFEAKCQIVQRLDLSNRRQKLTSELEEGDSVSDSVILFRSTPEGCLPPNLTVSGDLNAQGSSLKELPPGLKVSGTLNIRDTAVASIPPSVACGTLRATFGRISHEDVCRFAGMKAEPQLRREHTDQCRKSEPNISQAIIDEHFSKVFPSIVRKSVAVDWRVSVPKPGPMQVVAKEARTIYGL